MKTLYHLSLVLFLFAQASADGWSVRYGTHDYGATEDTDVISLSPPVTPSRAFVFNSNVVRTSCFDTLYTAASYSTDDIASSISLTDGSTLTVSRAATGTNNDARVSYQVVEGIESGSDSLISLGEFDVTISSGTSTGLSAAISGVTDSSRLVPILQAQTANIETRGWDRVASRIRIVDDAGSWKVQANKSSSSSTATLDVVVLQFGSAFTIEGPVSHTFTAAGVVETETLATATGAWNKKFIVCSCNSPGANSIDIGFFCYDGDTAESIKFFAPAGSNVTGKVCDAYVIQHDELSVEHLRSFDGGTLALIPDTGNTTDYDITDVPADKLLLLAQGNSSDTGQSWSRPFINFQRTVTNLTATHAQLEWCRSGQMDNVSIQAVNLSSVGPTFYACEEEDCVPSPTGEFEDDPTCANSCAVPPSSNLSLNRESLTVGKISDW